MTKTPAVPLSLRLLSAELSLFRWLILHKWVTGNAAIPIILRIRQAMERIEHE